MRGVRTVAAAMAASMAVLAVLAGAHGPVAAETPPPFPGPLYLEADTDASRAQARLLAAGDTAGAAAMGQIAAQPTAVWLGEWWAEPLMRSKLRRHVAAAAAQGTTAQGATAQGTTAQGTTAQRATLVFVTYAIPYRDCGGHSGGGTTYEAYLDWNRVIAEELAGTGAVILVEPDSLASLAAAKCAGEVTRRPALISQAVDILEGAGLATYLDGGNSNWLGPAAQAVWLQRAGIDRATGFFTNVSNFYPVQQESDYAGKLSARVGWKHYVIDVSRNGRGWTGTWCNPLGAALGTNPRSTAGTTKLDALLWVKHPGVSDGPCNGGPNAGVWWDAYALALVANRG